MLDKWLTHLRQDAPVEDNYIEHDSLQGNFELSTIFTILPRSYFSTFMAINVVSRDGNPNSQSRI